MKNMKKIIFALSVTLNIVFVLGILVFNNARRPGPKKGIRIQSAFKISQALSNGEVNKEDVLTEGNSYLRNHDYLDGHALVYHFEYDENSWKCAIGPMHPTYGPGVVFDSEGNIEVYKEKEFIDTEPYHKK